MTLRADTCETADGTTVAPYYVLEEKDWVNVVALDDAGRVLVVRQYRYAADTVCSELPAGAVEPGETPLDAAKRELREETGCAADKWRQISCVFANPARQTNRLFCFLAEDVRRVGEQSLDPAESLEFHFLSLDELHGLIRRGDFSQALHIASASLALFWHNTKGRAL